jgi:hypothetical protein
MNVSYSVIGALFTENVALKQEITTLKQEITTLNQEFTTLKRDRTKMEQNIEELNQNLKNYCVKRVKCDNFSTTEDTTVPTVAANEDNTVPTVAANEDTTVPTVAANEENTVSTVSANEENTVSTVSANEDTTVPTVAANEDIKVPIVVTNKDITVPTVAANEDIKVPIVATNEDNKVPIVAANEDNTVPTVAANEDNTVPTVAANEDNTVPTVTTNQSTLEWKKNFPVDIDGNINWYSLRIPKGQNKFSTTYNTHIFNIKEDQWHKESNDKYTEAAYYYVEINKHAKQLRDILGYSKLVLEAHKLRLPEINKGIEYFSKFKFLYHNQTVCLENLKVEKILWEKCYIPGQEAAVAFCEFISSKDSKSPCTFQSIKDILVRADEVLVSHGRKPIFARKIEDYENKFK